MRVVHSRKKVWDKDYAFEDAFTLLTWILSIIKWKEYGYQVVLYTDKETLTKIKEVGFDTLYDEINTSYLEDKNNIKDIDFWCFWAMPKILSLKAECEKGYNSIVADTDVVPMNSLDHLFNNKPYDLITWSNKEFHELKSIYPDLDKLSLPKDYHLPYWFTGKARPLNTGVIYFKDNKQALDYVREVIKISKSNHNHKENTRTQTMCNAEQRMIGEFAKHKSLYAGFIQPANESLFNRYGFHLHGYKNKLTAERRLQFNVKFLKAIQEHKPTLFKKLKGQIKFEEEIKNIDSNLDEVIELQQYRL